MFYLFSKLEEIGKAIGNTPVLRLNRIASSNAASIYLKLEYMNPGGSHKDRIAYYMLKDAIESGRLREGGCIVEVSSGNTALSLAWMCVRLGLKAIFIAEVEISPVKMSILKLLGAEVVKVDASGIGDVDPRFLKAKELEARFNGLFMNQFSNEANFRAHYETTAREIVDQLNGRVDAFVMGVGTGGTITGVGKYLKERLGGDVLVVGVVPRGSSIIHGKPVSGEYIDGLAKNVVPELFLKYRGYIDRVVEVSEKDAVDMVKMLALKEGLFVGPSTGAAVFEALKIAEELGPGKNVVTIAADSLMRYPHLL